MSNSNDTSKDSKDLKDHAEKSEETAAAFARRALREVQPTLVFLSGELMAVSVPLERETVSLGRAFEADVRLNDSKVSRLHAKIVSRRNDQTGLSEYVLIDLDASNGTYLNGQRIKEEVLTNGDKIAIGENLLRFDLLDEIDRAFNQQIHRLIAHDELTGLLTSRSFFSELRREAARSAAENRPFCVLMMDIDHFKEVNDTYGHMTGSQTIEEVGLCVMKAMRAGDVAARFGGEEFAALLLNATLGQGLVAAERVRRLIAETDFRLTRPTDQKTTHNITISLGVASFPDDSTDPIELVEMADSALYRAKRNGRNRIAAYRQVSPTDLLLPDSFENR